MLSNCGAKEYSWESLGQQGDQSSHSQRKLVMTIHWKDWCWSWNSNNLATWWEDLTHWKSLCSWERLRAGWEGWDRVWDGWMASLTQWPWVLSKLRETVKDRETWHTAGHEVTKSWIWLSDWATTNFKKFCSSRGITKTAKVRRKKSWNSLISASCHH